MMPAGITYNSNHEAMHESMQKQLLEDYKKAPVPDFSLVVATKRPLAFLTAPDIAILFLMGE